MTLMHNVAKLEIPGFGDPKFLRVTSQCAGPCITMIQKTSVTLYGPHLEHYQ